MHHPFGFEVLFTCQRAFITVTANAVPWNADLCLRIALRQIVTNILKVLTFFFLTSVCHTLSFEKCTRAGANQMSEMPKKSLSLLYCIADFVGRLRNS